MVSVKVQYGGQGGDPIRWFRGKREAIDSGNEEALQQAMEDGADLMRSMIATRGTAKSGKQGRIDSHKMHDSVQSEVRSYGQDKVEGRFGWIKTREDYFGYQEAGFTHVNSGEWVEGMYAMQDAADWALKQYKEDVKKVIKNA